MRFIFDIRIYIFSILAIYEVRCAGDVKRINELEKHLRSGCEYFAQKYSQVDEQKKS